MRSHYLALILLPFVACTPITIGPAKPTLVISWQMAEGIIKEGRVRKVHFPLSQPPVFTLTDGSEFVSTPPNEMKMNEVMPLIEKLSPSKGIIKFTMEWACYAT